MARLAPRGKQRTGGALRRLGAGALSFVAALLLLPSINPCALLGRQCGGGDAAAAGVVQPTSPTGTLMGLDGSPGPPAGLTQYDPGIVKRLWQYTAHLPPHAVRRGLYSAGDPARMRRFTHKLLSGKPVTLVHLGASVTGGAGAVHGNSYVTRFWDFIKQASPSAPHVFKNSGFGGGTSGVTLVCAQNMVLPDVDWVSVEFAVNDVNLAIRSPARLGLERLLRLLLEYENAPAVVMLNHYAWMPPAGANTSDYVINGENESNLIAQYYGIPSLSVRAAAYHLMLKQVKGFQVHTVFRGNENTTVEEDLFYWDHVHPLDGTGHKGLTDLLVAHIQSTARSLAERPLDVEDETEAQEALPPPMTSGNYQHRNSTCLLHLGFQQAVVAQRGFEWKDEGASAVGASRKWGWVGLEAGAWAEIQVDASTSTEGRLNDKRSEVVIAYLKSYEGMGRALVECVAGCECKPAELDGHWLDKKSLADVHRLQVSQHKECRLRVTVLDATSSLDGGKKVKLLGVMVVENGLGVGDGNTLHELGIRSL